MFDPASAAESLGVGFNVSTGPGAPLTWTDSVFDSGWLAVSLALAREVGPYLKSSASGSHLVPPTLALSMMIPGMSRR